MITEMVVVGGGLLVLISVMWNIVTYVENAPEREKARAEKENKETLRLVAQALGIRWNPYRICLHLGMEFGDRNHNAEYLLREIVRKGTPPSVPKIPSIMDYQVTASKLKTYYRAAESCQAGDVVEVLTSGRVAPVKTRKASR